MIILIFHGFFQRVVGHILFQGDDGFFRFVADIGGGNAVQSFQCASLITEQSGVKSASAAPNVVQTAQNTIPDFLMSSFLSVLFFRELTQSCYSNIADILSNPIPSVNVTVNRPIDFSYRAQRWSRQTQIR